MTIKNIGIGIVLIALLALLWQTQAMHVAPAAAKTVRLANGKVVNWPPQLGQPYPELELSDGQENSFVTF